MERDGRCVSRQLEYERRFVVGGSCVLLWDGCHGDHTVSLRPFATVATVLSVVGANCE